MQVNMKDEDNLSTENLEAQITKGKGVSEKFMPIIRKCTKSIKRNWQLYLLLGVPLLYILIFNYVPMYGAQIAFKNYRATDGIWGSKWVGFDHFIRFFNSYDFWKLIKNTLQISLYSLFITSPIPIILAISLKYVPSKFYRKLVQMVSYAPHFISTVVMVSIIIDVLDPRRGLLGQILGWFGIEFSANLMGSAAAFPHIYVWSGVWQGVGFGAIIYTAILSSVDPSLHEAAVVDGASLLQRIRHIDLPTLIPQFTLMLILNLGNVLNLGFEKVLLMQNSMNSSASEIIDTFVYKMGIAAPLPDISYTSAIGLFKSVVALILIYTVNKIARKYGETSLW